MRDLSDFSVEARKKEAHTTDSRTMPSISLCRLAAVDRSQQVIGGGANATKPPNAKMLAGLPCEVRRCRRKGVFYWG